MNKIIKELAVSLLVIGLTMLLFYFLLISGLVGIIDVSGFYLSLSFLFIGMGWLGLKNHHRF